MTESTTPEEAPKIISTVETTEVRAKLLKSIGASLFYGLVALLMGFVNKGVLQLWPYSNTLLTLQMATTIMILYIGQLLGALVVQPFNLKVAKNLFPVVFFYNANVAFALGGLQVLNIPVFNSLKRLTPVLTVAVRYAIGDTVPTRHVLYSVITITVGCIVAGIGDLSFEPLGYAMALISCGLQTAYLVLVEKSGSEKGYSSQELLLYNAGLSFPVLLAIIVATGEAPAALSAISQGMTISNIFIPLVVFSLGMGCLLNYTLFLCTLCNSALTTTIVGVMKGVFSSVLGFFLLGGVEPTLLVISGIFINTLGGIWYAYAKYLQKQEGIRESLFSIDNSKPLLPITSPAVFQ